MVYQINLKKKMLVQLQSQEDGKSSDTAKMQCRGETSNVSIEYLNIRRRNPIC